MARTNANTRRRINRRLVELRLDEGLTPNDLASRAQISGNTVRAAERGFYIDPRSQFAIAQALRVRVTEVFPFGRQRLERPRPKVASEAAPR